MEKDCKELLEERLVTEFEGLKTIEPGTAKHEQAVDNLVKLYKLKIEEDKAVNNEKLEMRRLDNEEVNFEHSRVDDAEKEKKHRVMQYIGYGLQGLGIVVPLIAYGKWYRDGLEFEKTGTVTSSFLKNLIGKFRPTGK